MHMRISTNPYLVMISIIAKCIISMTIIDISIIDYQHYLTVVNQPRKYCKAPFFADSPGHNFSTDDWFFSQRTGLWDWNFLSRGLIFGWPWHRYTINTDSQTNTWYRSLWKLGTITPVYHQYTIDTDSQTSTQYCSLRK